MLPLRDSVTYRSYAIAEEIKLKYCYISNPDGGTQNAESSANYTTADGETVQITEEHMTLPTKVIFGGLGGAIAGILESVEGTYGLSNPSLLPKIYSNIILAGGNSKIEGLEGAITRIKNGGKKYKVIALDNREYAAWIGAAKVVRMEDERLKEEEAKESEGTVKSACT